MSRFTKGPWVADKTSMAVGPVSNEDDQSYGMVLPVAWVEFEPEVEIQAANAKLIAAAPELLKELEETHAALCFTPDYIGSERYERNKSAIAKALGQ